MRKTGKQIKRFLLIFSVFLVSIFVFVAIALTTTVGWTKYGPYHRSAIVQVFDERDTKGEDDFTFLATNENIYRLSEGRRKSIRMMNSRVKLFYEDEKLFFRESDRLYSYDKNEKWENKKCQLRIDFIIGEYAYQVKQEEEKSFLLRYHRSDFSLDLSFKKYFEIYDFFEIDGKHLFAKENNYVVMNDREYAYDCTQIERYEKKHFICWNGGRWEHDGENIITVLSHVDEGIFYFSSTKRSKREDCVAWKDGSCCICDYGKSQVYKVDTNNNSIEEIRQLDSGCVPIRVEKEIISYYKNGEIYEDENKIEDVGMISVGEEYYELGEDHLHRGSEGNKNYIGYCEGYYYLITETK